MTQKITPCLWFDGNAAEAAAFYTAIFKNSKVGSQSNYEGESAEISGQPEGSPMMVEFEIAGQKYQALNGGPQFKFNESISFVIDVGDQEELDYYWSRLTSDGGEESMCGWLKDKFGVSWQVVPTVLKDLFSSTDKEAAQRSMHALFQMRKIDIQKLKDAFDGRVAAGA
jgi:predicted 3-demethylubiquinone-9 3-methyltransferase (glyoxalase superfamily)